MKSIFFVNLIFLFSFSAFSQNLSPLWEELTASDFVLAVEKSEGVCIIPIGAIEKHGQHLPLGTDMYRGREISQRAAATEYCIVFPYYFQGQILEGKHQPGTIAYGSDLLLMLLDETCKEIARNGIKKIILVNFHGGNNAFLQYFSMIQAESPRDYVVYVASPRPNQEVQNRINEMRKSSFDQHGGEDETSSMLAVRPDLVKMNRVADDSGRNQNQLRDLPQSIFTALKWYSSFPNHYAGDAKDANVELGKLIVDGSTQSLIEIIKAVKTDTVTPRLQNEFFKDSSSPLETKLR